MPRETLGAIIFQEQVLEVAMALAGFSVGEAEGLRRAMSRKRSQDAIEAHRERFFEGAAVNGVPEETAELVFSKINGFASFGFPSRTRPPSRCSPTSRPGSATTTPASSSARS